MGSNARQSLTTGESGRGKTAAPLWQTKKSKVPARVGSSVEQIYSLQRTVGNHEVRRLLGSGVIQAKLKVNKPGDSYEQEADRISGNLLATSAHDGVSRAEHILREAGQPGDEAVTAPASVHQALVSPGDPLAPALRREMEQRFGCDFSRVRVHLGASAEQSARDVNARAYTVGNNMVFGAGEFSPGTREGRRLLAHELTHVLQQSETQPNVVRRQGDFDDEEPTLRERQNPHRPPFRGHVERGGEKTPGNIASGEIDTGKRGGPTSGGGGGTPKMTTGGGTPKVTTGGGPPTGTSAGGTPKVKMPTINLSNYPAERGGPVTRFFKDRPVLQNAGLVGGSGAASAVSSGMLMLVELHFVGVLREAQNEFRTKYPQTSSLKQSARIDEHRAAYVDAVNVLYAPSNIATAARAGAVFVKEKDREAYLRHVEKRLSEVKLAKGGSGGFRAAAEAYESALADLQEKLSKHQFGLPDIAEDVRRRAEVLRRAGDTLMDAFWSVIQVIAYFPLAYYQTFDIYQVARVFQNLGDQVGAFAGEIRSRVNEYDRLEAWLDAELIDVGEQLNAPRPKRILRK